MPAATEWLVGKFQKRSGIACSLHVRNLHGDDDSAPDGQRGAVIFRIVQEALANIQHHAHATRVDVSLAIDEHDVAVTTVDDGAGLHPGDADQTARFVLNGMRERIDVFGGELQVQPSRRGGGRTCLLFRIPLAGKADLETAPA